jgi:hypothetical protein
MLLERENEFDGDDVEHEFFCTWVGMVCARLELRQVSQIIRRFQEPRSSRNATKLEFSAFLVRTFVWVRGSSWFFSRVLSG